MNEWNALHFFKWINECYPTQQGSFEVHGGTKQYDPLPVCSKVDSTNFSITLVLSLLRPCAAGTSASLWQCKTWLPLCTSKGHCHKQATTGHVQWWLQRHPSEPVGWPQSQGEFGERLADQRQRGGRGSTSKCQVISPISQSIPPFHHRRMPSKRLA